MRHYPEHNKLAAVKDRSQTVGEFIEWLSDEKGITLCTMSDDNHEFIPYHPSTTKLLAEFFEIDLDKIEAEKQAMLEALRSAHEPKNP